MKLKIAAIALLVMVGIIASDNYDSAHAQSIYTWEYNATNLYSDDVIVYEFSGLDATTEYFWTINTASFTTGEPLDRLATATIPLGTTGTWFFGVDVTGSVSGRWPANYTGPIVVIDKFGQVLGKHFITPKPLVDDGTDEWEASNGDFALGHKTTFGNLQSEGTCKSVVYNDINVNGHHHGFNACQSTTTFGDIALLHIQFDPAAYGAYTPHVTTTLDTITVEHITNPAPAPELLLDLDSFLNYQITAGFSSGLTNTARNSFLVVNTGNVELPYINYNRADAFFSTGPITNPMRFGDLNTGVDGRRGAYTCVRFDNTITAVADCESIWLVSNDPDPDVGNSAEWGLSVNPAVLEAGTQVATFTQDTTEIWSAMHGAMQYVDSYSGVTDNTIYAFDPDRAYSYTVNNTAIATTPVNWTLTPGHLHNLQVTQIPAEMTFTISAAYEIVNVRSVGETVEEAIFNLGLDTELGRTMLLGVILFFTMASISFIPTARTMPIAYLLGWTLVGGVFTAGGYGSGISDLLFGISTILLWLFAFTIPGQLFGMGSSEDDIA